MVGVVVAVIKFEIRVDVGNFLENVSTFQLGGALKALFKTIKGHSSIAGSYFGSPL